MNLRPQSNNTAVRFFNGNAMGNESTAAPPMLVQIEEGDNVSFYVPAGYTLKFEAKTDDGGETWGVSPYRETKP